VQRRELHRFAFEKKNVEEDQLLPEVSLGADLTSEQGML